MQLPGEAKEIRGSNLREEKYLHKDITERIIGCAIAVHKALNAGYVEAVYENSLAHELARRGLRFERQKSFVVMYDGVVVGEHRADVLVEDVVIVELKSVSGLTDQHVSQVMSTMKAAAVHVGLLINFGEARLIDGVRRVIL